MEIWKRNLIKLKAFKRKFGHCNVPSQWNEDRILSQWVENIRSKKHALPEALKDQLVKLHFNFDYNILNDWDAMYEKLMEFYNKHGHTEIPAGNTDYDLLSKWIERQRLSRRRLSPKDIKRLDEIEFVWDSRTAAYRAQWVTGFEKLRSYYHEFGTSRIEWKNTKFSALFEWSRSQIKRYKNGELSEDKIRLLDSIGFDWQAGRSQVEERKWQKRYEDLKKFKAAYGHCRVPSNQKDLRSLYSWIIINRMKINFLTEDQKKKLNALGFQWSWDIKNKKQEKWSAMYEKLKRFYKKHGHIKVTIRKDSKLSRWLVAQEERVSLSKDRYQKLKALGMVWKEDRKNKRDEHWFEMYDKLKKFYMENGHCVVPLKNTELRQWVQNLRTWNKTLTEEQKKKLKAIKFDVNWRRDDYVKLKWEKKYNDLKKFQKRFGHCNPSKHTGEYVSLGIWIANQRQGKDRLSAEQVKKLNQLGFEWGRGSLKPKAQSSKSKVQRFKAKP